MAESFTHRTNAQNALVLCGYTPRVMSCYIMGANGPDPMLYYQLYNPFKKHDMNRLGSLMHKDRTGLFLKNMFSLAQTDAEKDYCLGFLCHYSLDSLIHPYVYYIIKAYDSPFNIPQGHAFFESALDSKVSEETGNGKAAPVEASCPEIDKLRMDQMLYLLKCAVDKTYPEYEFSVSDYRTAFKDFRKIKNFLYCPGSIKSFLVSFLEKISIVGNGAISGHFQPGKIAIPPSKIWENEAAGLYCTETLENILIRADYRSARRIKAGLDYFRGIYTIDELMEDIGDKSYITGISSLPKSENK